MARVLHLAYGSVEDSYNDIISKVGSINSILDEISNASNFPESWQTNASREYKDRITNDLSSSFNEYTGKLTDFMSRLLKASINMNDTETKISNDLGSFNQNNNLSNTFENDLFEVKDFGDLDVETKAKVISASLQEYGINSNVANAEVYILKNGYNKGLSTESDPTKSSGGLFDIHGDNYRNYLNYCENKEIDPNNYSSNVDFFIDWLKKDDGLWNKVTNEELSAQDAARVVLQFRGDPNGFSVDSVVNGIQNVPNDYIVQWVKGEE